MSIVQKLRFSLDSIDYELEVSTLGLMHKLLLTRSESHFIYTCIANNWQVEQMLAGEWKKSVDKNIRFAGKGNLILALINKANDTHIDLLFKLDSNETYLQEIERSISLKYQDELMEIESQVFDIINMQNQFISKMEELRTLSSQLSSEVKSLPAKQNYLESIDEIGISILNKGKITANQPVGSSKDDNNKQNLNSSKIECLEAKDNNLLADRIKSFSQCKSSVIGSIKLIHLVSNITLILVTELNDAFVMNLATTKIDLISCKLIDRISKIDSCNSLVCFYLSDSVLVYDCEKKKTLKLITLGESPAGIVFKYESLIIGTQSGKLIEYNNATFEKMRQIDILANIVSICYEKGSGSFILASAFTLSTYDIGTLKKKKDCNLKQRVISLRIAGKFVYCQFRKLIGIWNYLENIYCNMTSLKMSVKSCASALDSFYFVTDSELFAYQDLKISKMELKSGLKSITSYSNLLVYCDDFEIINVIEFYE